MDKNFKLIDIEKWKRREIFYYFSRIAPTTYSVTASLDITRMMKALKEHNLKFFPSYLWLSTTIINKHQEFKVAIKDGKVGYYDTLTPFYPTFHDDDKTISMLWTKDSSSLFEFHEAYLENKKVIWREQRILGTTWSYSSRECIYYLCLALALILFFFSYILFFQSILLPFHRRGKVY